MKAKKLINAHNKALAILKVLESTEKQIKILNEQKITNIVYEVDNTEILKKIVREMEKQEQVKKVYDNQCARIFNLQNKRAGKIVTNVFCKAKNYYS